MQNFGNFLTFGSKTMFYPLNFRIKYASILDNILPIKELHTTKFRNIQFLIYSEIVILNLVKIFVFVISIPFVLK
ncbi:MAG: hypothetical protein BWX59_02464 [Bacteroidetes bacterium ADurb.Bin028]|nr:MAG: hypothetical protein BWX59_02464 [Bacteroidetes bacterium ADurb.Bin028]